MNIHAALRTIRQHPTFKDKSSDRINDGLCNVFAKAVAKQCPDAKRLWGSDLSRKAWRNKWIQRHWQDWFLFHTYKHCFIVHKGRYYDAECLQGVCRPESLPFYKRELVHYRRTA